MKWFLLLIPPLVYAATCNEGRNLQSEQGLKVKFELQSLQSQAGNCDRPSDGCAQVDFTFPLVDEGVAALKNAINDSILTNLIHVLVFEKYTGEASLSSLQMQADSFLLEWKKSSDESNGAGWEITVNGEVGLHTPKVAVVSLGFYSFSGGAHPNSFVNIFNFDLKSGRTLTWAGLVNDLESLKKIAEKNFRIARNLDDAANLNDAGFFWEEPFALPQNFEIQKDGIYCWYNPYEVAAYALGPTDFLLTYKELDGLLNRKLIF